jgi:catechol 2,3-dioxygenase-like lactoylglutathione lyase family enzyme
MGFHHVAVAVRDLAATHRFYTEACGFELVKSNVAPTDAPGGWAKHVFYDTGGSGTEGQPGPMIAFWELHDDRMVDFDPAISTGLGLQPWVNHIAFSATDLDDLAARRNRWLHHGHDVVEIDHGFCRSVYCNDPSGTLVEFCTDTAPYTEDDKVRALAALNDPAPELEPGPDVIFHLAAEHVADHAPA